jgi:hypothetical protein
LAVRAVAHVLAEERCVVRTLGFPESVERGLNHGSWEGVPAWMSGEEDIWRVRTCMRRGLLPLEDLVQVRAKDQSKSVQVINKRVLYV